MEEGEVLMIDKVIEIISEYAKPVFYIFFHLFALLLVYSAFTEHIVLGCIVGLVWCLFTFALNPLLEIE